MLKKNYLYIGIEKEYGKKNQSIIWIYTKYKYYQRTRKNQNLRVLKIHNLKYHSDIKK
jgi:hypothetical protein